MLTYTFDNTIKKPLYEQLYDFIKQDIISGTLKSDEHLPSKRTFAAHLGISMITVENSYAQLMAEGYIYSKPKRGYFVSDISFIYKTAAHSPISTTLHTTKVNTPDVLDFSDNMTSPEVFPFSVWAKLMREVISEKSEELMTRAPHNGVYALREAISKHLYDFRGIVASPDNIVVGAGTEYLYSLLVMLLGHDKIYAVENPGYQKIRQVYESNLVKCININMDEQGLRADLLKKSGADILHISPTHHFPTGITMPIGRRMELLNWAMESDERFIIEDDYDSEFKLSGRPIPALKGIDSAGKVIYINTFSKTLTPTIRVSYMVLPEKLMSIFKENLGFFSCTVSNFEQYTLARYIGEGYLEKHINRMRLYYTKQRDALISEIKKSPIKDRVSIILQDSGLHFLVKLNTTKSDNEVEELCRSKGIIIKSIKDYYYDDAKDNHTFIVNYSNISLDKVKKYFEKIDF